MVPMSDLLIELVKRYSPSQHEANAVLFLVDWMRQNGFDDTQIDPAGNASGIKGSPGARNTLVLLGHIDTVPGEIPVKLEDDNYLYGRGTVDAKGSLCAFAEATAKAQVPSDWQVRVIGAVEEETAASSGAIHVRDTLVPDLCIIGEPSGWDRITLGYKGRLLVNFALERSKSHSARPEPTVGALGSAYWQCVVEWCDQANRGVTRYFDQIMPSLRSFNTTNGDFAESVNLTIGFRLPPTYSPESVYEVISGFAPPDALMSRYGSEQAYLADKNSVLVRGLLSAIRRQGGKPGFVLKTGTSDMNVVGAAWPCPIVAYGPGDSNLDHTPNEHISLAEYQQSVNVLRELIENLKVH